MDYLAIKFHGSTSVLRRARAGASGSGCNTEVPDRSGTEVIETEKLTKMKLSLNELKYNISCYLRERIKRFGTDFLSNDFYAVPYFIFANISEKFMSPWSDIRK